MARSIRDDTFLSPEELAEILKLETAEIYRLLRDNEIPAIPLGGTWRVREKDLLEFFETHVRHPVVQHAREKVRTKRSPGQAEDQGIRFVLLGREGWAASFADMLAQVLEELSAKDSAFLERFSEIGGRTRRYVARSRDALYEGRIDLARRFSRQITGGWWVGTNYSRTEIASILKKACDVAGLSFGVDLVLGGRSAGIDKRKAMAFVAIAADPDPQASQRHDELFAEAVLNEKR